MYPLPRTCLIRSGTVPVRLSFTLPRREWWTSPLPLSIPHVGTTFPLPWTPLQWFPGWFCIRLASELYNFQCQRVSTRDHVCHNMGLFFWCPLYWARREHWPTWPQKVPSPLVYRCSWFSPQRDSHPRFLRKSGPYRVGKLPQCGTWEGTSPYYQLHRVLRRIRAATSNFLPFTYHPSFPQRFRYGCVFYGTLGWYLGRWNVPP